MIKSSKSENNLSSLIIENKNLNNTIRISSEQNISKPINIITPRSGIVSRKDIIQNEELNYSVYIEKKIAISQSPDDCVNSIFPKRNDKWVDSNIINRCQNCDCNFSLFVRKHHCRACGGVYCYNCCNKYMKIPENIIKKPEQENNYKISISNSIRWLYGEKLDLVCKLCEKKINDLKQVEHFIKICEYLDIDSLYTTKLVSKNFRIASIHVLSKFRDIQYGSHTKLYTNWEMDILWNSREYLYYHSVWFTVLIKSVITYTQIYKKTNRINIIDEYFKNINEYNKNNRNRNCIFLLCSRKCTRILDFDDIIEILDFIKFSIKQDENLIEIDNLKNIIIHLIKILIEFNKLYMIFPILSNILNFFFEYDKIYLDNNFVGRLFNLFFIYNIKIQNIITIITFEQYFIDSYNNNIMNINNDNFLKMITRHIVHNFGSELLNDILQMSKSINNILNNKMNITDLPFIYPFDISYKVIKINERIVISSNTMPILLDVVIANESNEVKNIKFIIKKDKSLRKEQLISCLIDILQYKLNNMNCELIPTYKIIMLNKDVGIVEYVEHSTTLRTINDKGYTLQNYILNMNINNKLDTIKTRFVHSLAISSAIAYIIGLGDRHLDNIMINKYGQIFHIDYGYIMENPIKLFNMPEIKLTNDIIDFLGGINSVYYEEFKKLIVQIYNLYRANKNILYIFFKFICDSGYLDWNIVSSKLDTKLMTGMKCKDVEITLINEIDSSNTITDMISDMCHSYKQKLFF
jgi:hypothetical protein